MAGGDLCEDRIYPDMRTRSPTGLRVHPLVTLVFLTVACAPPDMGPALGGQPGRCSDLLGQGL